MLHDVERGEFYIESKGSVSTLSHDVEIDGIDFYVFIEMLYFFVSYSIFGFHAAVCMGVKMVTKFQNISKEPEKSREIPVGESKNFMSLPMALQNPKPMPDQCGSKRLRLSFFFPEIRSENGNDTDSESSQEVCFFPVTFYGTE